MRVKVRVRVRRGAHAEPFAVSHLKFHRGAPPRPAVRSVESRGVHAAVVALVRVVCHGDRHSCPRL